MRKHHSLGFMMNLPKTEKPSTFSAGCAVHFESVSTTSGCFKTITGVCAQSNLHMPDTDGFIVDRTSSHTVERTNALKGSICRCKMSPSIKWLNWDPFSPIRTHLYVIRDFCCIYSRRQWISYCPGWILTIVRTVCNKYVELHRDKTAAFIIQIDLMISNELL